ncbi:Protein trichome birefringence-like 9, partial [Dichanthelium oligosanthes]
MPARHVFVPSVFLFLLALICLVGLLPPRGSPPLRSFFQPWLPLISGTSGTEHDSAGSECDYSDGRWVRNNDTNVTAYTEDCPFLDPGFRCMRNGRRDSSFRYWRWQPRRCHLPKFNATEMLERSRNGRIVFAGDSIGRNQWESM